MAIQPGCTAHVGKWGDIQHSGSKAKHYHLLAENGLSLSSTILLLKKYRSHLKIDIQESAIVFDSALIGEMHQANENQIIIYEIQSFIR